MEKKYQVEIKSEDDRATIAKILFNNGYTVRKSVIQKQGSKTKTTVLEFWKGEEKGIFLQNEN